MGMALFFPSAEALRYYRLAPPDGGYLLRAGARIFAAGSDLPKLVTCHSSHVTACWRYLERRALPFPFPLPIASRMA